MILEMVSTDGAESLLARQREPSDYGGVRIASRDILREALANGLHASVDGRACAKATSSHISMHQWVADATGLLSGANYIGTVKVRGTLFPRRSEQPGVAKRERHLRCLSTTCITGSHSTGMSQNARPKDVLV